MEHAEKPVYLEGVEEWKNRILSYVGSQYAYVVLGRRHHMLGTRISFSILIPDEIRCELYLYLHIKFIKNCILNPVYLE